MPGIPPGESDYRPTVFVCGKYATDDPSARNRTRLEEAVTLIIENGGNPVCPAFLLFPTPATAEQSRLAGFNSLSRCEALFDIEPDSVLPSQTASERQAAVLWDIPIFNTEETVLAWIEDQLGLGED